MALRSGTVGCGGGSASGRGTSCSFSRSVSPSSSSMTAYAAPPSRPKSKIERMLGCDSAATAFASRSKRSRAAELSARCGGSTLIATSRSSLVSRARYTSPIPPVPMAPTISYGPSFVPAASISVGPRLADATPRTTSARRRFRTVRGWRQPVVS